MMKRCVVDDIEEKLPSPILVLRAGQPRKMEMLGLASFEVVMV